MNIDVVGHIRPSIRGEGPVSLEIDGHNRLASRPGGTYISFKELHKQEASNYDVFKKSIEPLVDLCVAGFNTCLVITGESGAGKSFATAGESTSKSGLVPIIIEHLFAQIGEDDVYMYDSRVSQPNRVYMEMYEVYNEMIKDLGAVPGVQTEYLEIDESAIRGAHVKDLNSIPLTAAQDGVTQFRQAWARRTNSQTDLGYASDLSFTVIQFELTLRSQESPLPNKSKLTVVVTPGTEKLNQDLSEIRMREGATLSKSLITLSQLVATLANQNYPERVVNYTDSKMTSLLRDELGGNCKTQVLVCLKPQSDPQSLSATIRLAAQLAQVKNFPIINDPFSQQLLSQYRARIMSLQQQLGLGAGLSNPGAIHDVQEELRRLQTENLQLRDKNERLHLKLDQAMGKFGSMAATKTDLSAQLLMTEEEKLKVSKTLVEMQIENNKIREESEAGKFELTNRILQVENDLVEMEMERDKYAKAARNSRERLSEVEKDRKDLADEYVSLKSNFMALTKAHEKEVGRNEELSTELMNMVNAKAALMRRLDRQLDSARGESPSAEVDRVRAIVSRLSFKRPGEFRGSQKDKDNLERSLFADQRRYEGEIDRVRHEYEDDYKKLSKKLRQLQSELQVARTQARDRGKEVSELSAQLISSRNWKENLEMQNNRLNHKLKDVSDEFRSRLVKYVEDISEYVDRGAVPDMKKDETQMKEYVSKMLADLKRAHKVREEQLSQALQSARKNTEDVVRKHEELLVAYRNLRQSAATSGYEGLDLGPDESKIQMNDSALVSQQQGEINRLREDLNQATNELESLKLRMRMGNYSEKDIDEKDNRSLSKDKTWATLRKQLHEFTLNTQEELESERAELLSKNAMLEQEVQELQEYIDSHLARYKEEIDRLRKMLSMEGDGFNSPGPSYRQAKKR